MSKNLIFALPGFLGQASDWDATKHELARLREPQIDSWVTPELFSPAALPIENFDSYVHKLIKKHEDTFNQSAKKIFIGYSLGGRLGLHILKLYPKLFDHLIFISVNSGLTTEQEKSMRLQQDQAWLEKMNCRSWSEFLIEWNSQAVFEGKVSPPDRNKNDFDIEKLKLSLQLWSLGRQEDLAPVIAANHSKISWVVGTKDTKFLALTENLKQKKILLDFSRIFSGHRILHENSKALAQLTHQFT